MTRAKFEVAVLGAALIMIALSLVSTPIGRYILAIFGGTIQYGL